MMSQDKSARIPVLISLLVSAIVLVTLWQLKDSPLSELALRVTLWFSLSIFVIFLVYFITTSILFVLKKSIWLKGITSALLIYFGIIIMSLSYFTEMWSYLVKEGFDPSILALGTAVFAIGMAFYPRHKPALEETLKELKAHSDELGGKVADFSKTQTNLNNISGSVLAESEKFLISLSAIIEQSKRKPN